MQLWQKKKISASIRTAAYCNGLVSCSIKYFLLRNMNNHVSSWPTTRTIRYSNCFCKVKDSRRQSFIRGVITFKKVLFFHPVDQHLNLPRVNFFRWRKCMPLIFAAGWRRDYSNTWKAWPNHNCHLQRIYSCECMLYFSFTCICKLYFRWA